jgi:uncharacterized protein YjaG (DUF416 family)
MTADLKNKLDLLKEMSFTKQKAFAYLTCERLYPNYVYFFRNYGFGDTSVLRKAIDFLFLNLFEMNLDKNKTNLLIGEIEKNTPDTEDYSTSFVSSALDACTAVNESLEFLTDKKFSRIIDISTFAMDTVDMRNNHPLIKREMAIQSGIVIFLGNCKTLEFEDVQTLLHLQENHKKGSLDL